MPKYCVSTKTGLDIHIDVVLAGDSEDEAKKKFEEYAQIGARKGDRV